MIHLASIHRVPTPADSGFPFTVPVLKAFESFTFTAPITFFVGENGSGKSTLLEAIACAVGSITVGREAVTTDPSLNDVRRYAKTLRLSWHGARNKRGFFMRAEDFFGYAREQERLRAEMLADIEQVDRDYADRSPTARGLAKMPFSGQLADMKRRYGNGLDAASHGESFFRLFANRFVPGGLYLLDEPEAPLSPLRQLSLLTMLRTMIDQDAQFVIATHSPILMAFPEAAIVAFDGGTIHPVTYDETEHVSVMRSFLADPESYLRHLMK